MSGAIRFDLAALTLNTTVLSGIRNWSLPFNPVVVGDKAGSELYPRLVSLREQKPEFSIGSLDVGAWLTAIATSGAGGGMFAAASGAGLKFFLAKHAAGGLRETGTAHMSVTAIMALLAITRLNAEHGQDAMVDIRGLVGYDGTNAPLVPAAAVALPTASEVLRFTLSQMTLGGVAFTGKMGWTLDTGLQLVGDKTDDDTYPTGLSVQQGDPVLTIRGINPATWFAAAGVPLSGLAGTHANTTFYLKKRAAGGGFVADGTAEHIKITMDGLVNVQDISGQAGQPATCTLQMVGRHDGTNLPVTVTVGSAIT